MSRISWFLEQPTAQTSVGGQCSKSSPLPPLASPGDIDHQVNVSPGAGHKGTEQKILEECRKPGHRDQGRVGQRTRDCHLVDCSWQKALTLCLTMRGSDQCQQGQCFKHP